MGWRPKVVSDYVSCTLGAGSAGSCQLGPPARRRSCGDSRVDADSCCASESALYMYLAPWMQAVQGRASFGLLHVDAAAVEAASMLTRDARSSQLRLYILHLGCRQCRVVSACAPLHVDAAAVVAAVSLPGDPCSDQHQMCCFGPLSATCTLSCCCDAALTLVFALLPHASCAMSRVSTRELDATLPSRYRGGPS